MDRSIGYEIKTVDSLIARKGFRESKKHNSISITPLQMKIVVYLLDNINNDMYQKDIENIFQFRRSTISGILDTMEKNNILYRENSLKDKRSKRIILKEDVIKMVSDFKKNINEFEKQVIKDIPKDDLNIFFKVIDKIKSNLKEEDNDKIVQKFY